MNDRNGGRRGSERGGWTLAWYVCAWWIVVTHISSLLLSYLQFLLGVLQGFWILIELILSWLQLLLHLNQLVFMLGERAESGSKKKKWIVITYIMTVRPLLSLPLLSWHFITSPCLFQLPFFFLLLFQQLVHSDFIHGKFLSPTIQSFLLPLHCSTSTLQTSDR